MNERTPSAGEELANTLSHGFGLLLSVFVALPSLVVWGVRQRDVWQLAGGVIFGASLVLLYGVSTLYHLLRPGRAKQLCRLLDHAAIYVLIAGTYTPFALGALRGPLGWTLLAAVWTLGAAGFALKLKVGFRYPLLSTAVYLLMGWLVLVVVRPLVAQIGLGGFGWLLAGGLSYSLGVFFFVWEQLRFSHLYWHGFVLAGSACHFIAVVGYAAARAV
jgi:hemolysin III